MVATFKVHGMLGKGEGINRRKKALDHEITSTFCSMNLLGIINQKTYLKNKEIQ